MIEPTDEHRKRAREIEDARCEDAGRPIAGCPEPELREFCVGRIDGLAEGLAIGETECDRLRAELAEAEGLLRDCASRELCSIGPRGECANHNTSPDDAPCVDKRVGVWLDSLSDTRDGEPVEFRKARPGEAPGEEGLEIRTYDATNWDPLVTVQPDGSVVLSPTIMDAIDTARRDSTRETVSMADATWTKRDPVDGDPRWMATFGDAALVVHVECEWCFGWSIEIPGDYDLARGSVYIAEGDEIGDTAWDYQHVERAQARCETVARALLTEAPTTGHGGELEALLARIPQPMIEKATDKSLPELSEGWEWRRINGMLHGSNVGGGNVWIAGGYVHSTVWPAAPLVVVRGLIDALGNTEALTGATGDGEHG